MAVLEVVLIVSELLSVTLTSASAGVYILKSMRCTTAVYLVALNAADTLGVALVAWRTLWAHVGGAGATGTLAYSYLTLVGANFLGLALRRSVYCLSVIVSLERFFVITFPLQARYFKIIRYPKLTVLVLMVIVFCFHVYLPLKYQVVALPAGTGNGYRLGHTDRYRQHEKAFGIVSNSAKFLFAYIPLCLGLAMSVALFVALRRYHVTSKAMSLREEDGVVVVGAVRASSSAVGRQRQGTGGSCRRGPKRNPRRSAERQLARTIWLSTFLFTLLSLPANSVHLVSTYDDTFGYRKTDHAVYMLVMRCSYLGIVFSTYTNFFSYLCLSTAFRQNLIRGILPRKIATTFLCSTQSRENGRTTGGSHGTGISVVSSSFQKECSL